MSQALGLFHPMIAGIISLFIRCPLMRVALSQTCKAAEKYYLSAQVRNWRLFLKTARVTDNNSKWHHHLLWVFICESFGCTLSNEDHFHIIRRNTFTDARQFSRLTNLILKSEFSEARILESQASISEPIEENMSEGSSSAIEGCGTCDMDL
jgi:hypothetical protein